MQARDDNPVTPRAARISGVVGLVGLLALVLACFGSLPWTLGPGPSGTPRYRDGDLRLARLPPWWASPSPGQAVRLNDATPHTPDETPDAVRARWPSWTLGTDALGRSMLARVLAGGTVSLGVGLAAALVSVVIGTLVGGLSGYAGGRVDNLIMRTVDVLYGLPYVLMVVLLAIAGDAIVGEYLSRQRERSAWVEAHVTPGAAQPDRAALEAQAREALPERRISEPARRALDLGTLLVAIGGVSWLTMARVVRAQVLSLKTRPFIEAARAMGASPARVFFRHMLPNLAGTITAYATLAVPQAILQESFLSFLGIGVRPPLPSWGVLASEGLSELNPYESNWWLLATPCVMLAATLITLNVVGEGLRRRWVG